MAVQKGHVTSAADPELGPSPTKRRRTQPTRQKRSGKNLVDLTEEADEAYVEPNVEAEVEPIKAKKKLSKGKVKQEKRLRQYRKKAPQSFLGKLERATTQRMFVVDRTRSTDPSSGAPCETVELAGSTGNIYTITISSLPSCTCPDYGKGNQCKHIVYVLHNVLKAPADLEYQLAFLTPELREIFEKAPLQAEQKNGKGADEGKNGGRDGKKTDERTATGSLRKSMEGEDCPICCMPLLDEDDEEEQDIVWCRAACGNNVHRLCFETWAKTKGGMTVTCVYCRTPWVGDDDSIARINAIKAKGAKNNEGYLNVGDALGMSSYRDTSTYHDFFVRRHVRDGGTFDTR